MLYIGKNEYNIAPTTETKIEIPSFRITKKEVIEINTGTAREYIFKISAKSLENNVRN